MEIDFESPVKRDDFRSDLTPLIDVIFQLLVFFILTSSFLLPHLDLQLPEAESNAAERELPRLVLSINSEGKYYLNQQIISENELERSIQTKLKELDIKDLHFQADKDTPYDTILQAMVHARNAGAKGFFFIHEE